MGANTGIIPTPRNISVSVAGYNTQTLKYLDFQSLVRGARCTSSTGIRIEPSSTSPKVDGRLVKRRGGYFARGENSLSINGYL